MIPGLYQIAPVTFDGAAWPWGQYVIKPIPLSPGSSVDSTPDGSAAAGSQTAGEAHAYPRGLRLVGHNEER